MRRLMRPKMASKRTGTLVPKPSGFFARVWVKLPDGTEERRWVNLHTRDRTTAKRKLARLVAGIESGELVADATAKVAETETYKAYTLDRHEARKRSGVVMASDEQNNREGHIYPIIGAIRLTAVTDNDVRLVLRERSEE